MASSRKLQRVLHYQSAKRAGCLPPRKPRAQSGPTFGTIDDGRAIHGIFVKSSQFVRPSHVQCKLIETKDDPKNTRANIVTFKRSGPVFTPAKATERWPVAESAAFTMGRPRVIGRLDTSDSINRYGERSCIADQLDGQDLVPPQAATSHPYLEVPNGAQGN